MLTSNLPTLSVGIIMRDEMVFRVAKRNNLSVAMVMSGGYQVGTFFSQLIMALIIMIY